MKRFTIVILFLAVAALAFGQQKSNEEKVILGLMDQLRQASIKGDPVPFEKLLVDDYLSVGISGVSLLTKADAIASFKSGKLKYDAIDASDEKVRLYGDTAVVNSVLDIKGHFGDNDIGGKFRTVRVWVKINGQWKNVSHQYTRIVQ